MFACGVSSEKREKKIFFISFSDLRALMVNLGKEGGRRELVRRWSRVRRSLEDPKESSKWMMIVAVGVVGVCAAGYWWWSSRSGRGDGDDSEDGDLTKPKG